MNRRDVEEVLMIIVPVRGKKSILFVITAD